MTDILLAANPVLIIAMLVYQHYRLKYLEASMTEQRRLLSETKDVVTQQATAISSQAAVVDTAIRYSQAFDPAKLEDILRRQIAAETADERLQLQQEAQRLRSGPDLAKQAIEIAQNTLTELLTPIVRQFVIVLFSMQKADRDEAIASIEEEKAQALIRSIVDRAEEAIASRKLTPPKSG